MTSLNQKDVYTKIIEHNINDDKLVSHQINTYDDFMTHGITDIISYEVLKLNDDLEISFSNPVIKNPTVYESNRSSHKLFPFDARRRDLTYLCQVYVSVELYSNVDKKVTIRNNVLLCEIPCMLKSQYCNLKSLSYSDCIDKGECEYDSGGYFIIRGKERVVIPQIRNAYNTPYIFTKENNRYVCEVRSMSAITGHSVLSKMYLDCANNKITMHLPYMKHEIPIILLFYALGIDDYKTIFDMIGIHEDYAMEIIKKNFFYTHICLDFKDDNNTCDLAHCFIGIHSCIDDGLRNKGNNYIEYSKQIIKTELFPHLGPSCSDRSKGAFLSIMIRQLILTNSNRRVIDDRDNYANKRIESTGVLCYELFRQLFRKQKDTMINILDKKKNAIDIIDAVSKVNSITKGFIHCMGSGNWGVPKTSYIRPGVCQVLSRLSYGSTLSHKRRLSIPIGKESKNTKIRQYGGSQTGFICPCETPEGQSVGIVLNLSILATITTNVPYSIIANAITNYSTCVSLDDFVCGNCIILINGIVYGNTSDPTKFVNEILEMRSLGCIHKQISCIYNDIDNCIMVNTDAGRLSRPVLNMKDGKPIFLFEDPELKSISSWQDLVDKNYVTYIDVIESNNSVISFYHSESSTNYKYCEISPAVILGVMGNIIPWPDHSQSPRNCYQTSMGKQAMSMYTLTFKQRKDTVAHVLGYPQKPLVSTQISRLMGFDDMPSGINAIVAVATYTGFNQEDSIIVNQSAIERGLFDACSFRTYVFSENKANPDMIEEFCKPPLRIRHGDGNYFMLAQNGIVKTRHDNGKPVYLNVNDVILGRITYNKKANNEIFDTSIMIKKGEEGFVDSVDITVTPTGYKMIKVVIRQPRPLEVGDKLASRAAQKGTVGNILSQHDMPFTCDGITPDLIINPHCIPSRMTINQLMESVFGKSGVIEGFFGDATPFQHCDTANDIVARLKKNGMDGSGNEILYNGMTGQPMGSFFIGPVYYQRLKHLVKDKIHARSTGVVTTLTKQPLEGRSRDGGLRFGEMERDCMISQGTSRFLKERLCEQSDPYSIPVCDTCGQIPLSRNKCHVCNTSTVNEIEIPYISKLVLQELNCMNIKTVINT